MSFPIPNNISREFAAPRRKAQPSDDLHSRVARLEEDMAKLKAVNAQLREENDLLRAEVGPSREQDPGFSGKLRAHLRELARREGKEVAWDVNERFDHPNNKKVVSALKDYFRSLPEDAKMPTWNDQTVEFKAHNNFRGACTSQWQKRDGTHTAANKRRAAEKRRDTKRKDREAALQGDPQLLDIYPGGKALLERDLMSDDEDIKDEIGDVAAIKTLRPSWRTDKANEFLDLLTAVSRRAKLACNPKRRSFRHHREYGTAETRVRESLLADLPRWSKTTGFETPTGEWMR